MNTPEVKDDAVAQSGLHEGFDPDTTESMNMYKLCDGDAKYEHLGTEFDVATIDDLAALARRLAHSLRQASPDDLPEKAVDYLQRKGLQGSPLRKGSNDKLSTSQQQSALDRKVIRQLLEGEIISHCKSAERHAAINAFDAAAKDDAIRQGISHALFVLAIKCGV